MYILIVLCVPRVRTCFGSRGFFSVAAPTIWNSLPLDIRNSCSIASFRRQLKTFLVSTSGRLQRPASPQRLRFGEFLADNIVRFINLLTYLLTYLNWQLACQFFSANNISYRIVSYSPVLPISAIAERSECYMAVLSPFSLTVLNWKTPSGSSEWVKRGVYNLGQFCAQSPSSQPQRQ